MSLSSSTDQISSKNGKDSEEKNPSIDTFISVHSFVALSLKKNQQYNENINFERNEKIQLERKSGINYLSQTGYAQYEQGLYKQENSSENKNNLNNHNFEDSNNFIGYANQPNLLEFIPFKCPILLPYTFPQQFPYHFYPDFRNYFTYGNIIPKTLFVSKAFSSNFLGDYQIPSYPHLKIIPKVSKPKFKTKKSVSKEKKNIKINSPKKEEDKPLIKLFFNIPDDFLNEFELKEIKFEKLQINNGIPNQSNTKKITFKDMEIYINNLCTKILNKDMNQNGKYLGEEYIEYENLNKEENNTNFLQRKRKTSRDLSDEYPRVKIKIGSKSIKIKNQPLKKKCKKKNKKITRKLYKINNSKNGDKICVNLNQIQIQKSKLCLEKFPFHPLLNSKEITKITFLKGILDRKVLIKINKKNILSKEKNYIKDFSNKRFKLIYKKNNENIECIVYVNSVNILYIILYYYYQIHKNINQLNINHYAHAALYKSLIVINKLDLLIKNCNAITNGICKVI